MLPNDNSAKYAALVLEWQASGQTQQDFCRDRNLPFHTFYYYLKRNKAVVGLNEAKPGFVPLKVKKSIPSATGPDIEIIYPGGTRIVLHGKVEAAYLRTLAGQ